MSRFVFFVICCVVLGGCRQKSSAEQEAMRFLGSTVEVGDGLMQAMETGLVGREYILVIYLPTEECVPCKMEHVRLLRHYQSDLERFGTGVAVVIQDTAREREIRDMFERERLDYSLVCDRDDELIGLNPTIANPLCHTFIMDRGGRVVWIGSPVLNEQSLERYRKAMEALLQGEG